MRLSITYGAHGEPNGGYLVVQPMPSDGRVFSVGNHTYLVLDKRRRLCVANFYSRDAVNLKWINRLLEYFGEKPLRILT